ncbi:methionyl-tRNA formyltransferase, mitochondrial [Aricia agestis]|uniref:methionyl-tRNA formyltransferase, mitochondrial n=1 Tax=Aricia agestis TaxID=91739 RepID=UPI001C206058|nr:methionyl-tRNA formyltransferase, mitochondrial [Aricia agestis]
MTFLVYNLSCLLSSKTLRNYYKYYNYTCNRSYYNVLFFGSDSIALKSLQKVNEYRKKGDRINRLDFVTSNNSKNKTAIELYAQSEEIKTLSWPNLNIRKGEYDLGLIVAFGHLIKDDVLRNFPLGMINIHPSLLPRWRGAAPIIYTLLHGEEETGVSLMKIKPDIFDVGEIISQVRVPVSTEIKLPELTEQLSDIGADMLVECLKTLPTSLENARPQSNEGVTYAKKISKSISEVRWKEMTAKEVYNLYRAVYGLYPLSTKFRDKNMKLFKAFLLKTEEVDTSQEVGAIQYCSKTNAVRILCKDRRYIYFKSLRIVGKREISALDFYNGYIKNVSLDKRKLFLCCWNVSSE